MEMGNLNILERSVNRCFAVPVIREDKISFDSSFSDALDRTILKICQKLFCKEYRDKYKKEREESYGDFLSKFCVLIDSNLETLNEETSRKVFVIARKILQKGEESVPTEKKKLLYQKIDAIFCKYGSEKNVKSFLRVRDIYRIPNDTTKKAMKSFLSNPDMNVERIQCIIKNVRAIEKKKQWFQLGCKKVHPLLKDKETLMGLIELFKSGKKEKAIEMILLADKIYNFQGKKVKECNYEKINRGWGRIPAKLMLNFS